MPFLMIRNDITKVAADAIVAFLESTGFGVGKLLKLDSTKCRAISIEVGMQNSGLATSLAAAHFAQYPLATIPGAVFSVWHNISGAVLANFFARTAEKKD